ncbi:hypothetical protein LCGC14_0374330 [marine sediment metagenome]|uniref:Uncharacterized protein n=1 Tax=marine sediment metagenome TaxID=412755 RepID=A0A0F9WCW3_9ZZZZ
MDEEESKATNDTKKNREQIVGFNLGQKQLELIGSLLVRATTLKLDGDYLGSYQTFLAVKLKIIANLNRIERFDMKKIEIKLQSKCGRYNFLQDRINSLSRDCDDQTNSNKLELEILEMLELYETTIMELLESKGYLIPLRQNSTSLFGQRNIAEH